MRRVTADRWAWLCLIVVMLVTDGCGGGPADAPDLGQVTGTVTLDGKPLAGAEVQFLPEDGRPSTGVTDAAGKYELAYTGESRGAKIGKHRVQIRTGRYVEKENGETEMTEESLPAKYHDKSELTADVVAGENTVNFDLTSQ